MLRSIALSAIASVFPFVGTAISASPAEVSNLTTEASPQPLPEEGPGFAVGNIIRGIRLTWEGQALLDYTIWWSPALDPTAWEEIGKVFARKSGTISYFDSERVARLGFYRIEERRPMILIPGSDGGGVDYDFYIGRYEVTIAEFGEFLADPACDDWEAWHAEEQMITMVWDVKTSPFPVVVTGWEDRPIQTISWEAAAAFCNWLSERDGLEKVYDETAGWSADISKNGYRLPTSNEWYKAACWDPTKDGGGGFWKYATRSDNLTPSLANYGESGDPYEHAPTYEYRPTHNRSTPVGFFNGTAYRIHFGPGLQKDPFPTEDARSYYGCYDMEGNVSEYIMIESEGGPNPGVMGSRWTWSYPATWELLPISEPRGISYIDERYSVGFRLARTAP